MCFPAHPATQTYQEETEFQQGIDDARGRRRAAGSAAGSQVLSQAAIIAQQEKQSAKQLKDAALLYARCLQHLLKVRVRPPPTAMTGCWRTTCSSVASWVCRAFITCTGALVQSAPGLHTTFSLEARALIKLKLRLRPTFHNSQLNPGVWLHSKGC